SAARPGSVARLAQGQALEADYLFGSARGLFELDLEVVAQIVASSGPRTRAPAPGAEEVSENIRENFLETLREVEPAEGPLPLRTLKGTVSKAIVLGTSLGIRQHLVGFVYFLEPFFGLLVAGVTIGVELDRETTVGLLQVVVGSAAGCAE